MKTEMSYREMKEINKSVDYGALNGLTIEYTRLGHITLTTPSSNSDLLAIDGFLSNILPCLNITTNTKMSFNSTGLKIS